MAAPKTGKTLEWEESLIRDSAHIMWESEYAELENKSRWTPRDGGADAWAFTIAEIDLGRSHGGNVILTVISTA